MTTRVRKKPGSDLDDIETRFVHEYLVDLSQANAMRRADGGKREKAWRQLGYQMMQKPHVRAAIDKALAEQAKRLDATSDVVKREIVRMALFDPAHVTGVTCPEDIAQLPEDVRRAIVGWSWDRQGNFTVKLAKEGALDMLARHFGLYEADNNKTLTLKKTPANMTDEELLAIASRKPNADKRRTGR